MPWSVVESRLTGAGNQLPYSERAVLTSEHLSCSSTYLTLYLKYKRLRGFSGIYLLLSFPGAQGGAGIRVPWLSAWFLMAVMKDGLLQTAICGLGQRDDSHPGWDFITTLRRTCNLKLTACLFLEFSIGYCSYQTGESETVLTVAELERGTT